MTNDMKRRVAESQRRQGRKNRLRKMAVCLAAILTFSMTCATAAPDVVGVCQIPEHTHSEACYTQAGGETHKELACVMESASCDHIVHRHDGSCYDGNGELWCRLLEVEEHVHDEYCYTQDLSAVHQHTDDCYAREEGEGVQTDGEANRERAHGDLICAQSTEPPAPKLTCTKREIVLHEHSDDCFDEDEALICGQIEVLEHQHSDACFHMVSETVKTLICDMEEHTHTEECHISEPTEEPTATPTAEPTGTPTEEPTATPTTEPTAEPTGTPTEEPTATPTGTPTGTPTTEPTATPTATPTEEPTATPTEEPTATPTAEPTGTPTEEPTATPTEEPTATPTAEPTATPAEEPTATPTAEPTATPTEEPTATPTAMPTAEPTATPTEEPTATPTAEPTATPTAEPTAKPTATPVEATPDEAAEEPTTVPATEPTARPAEATEKPTTVPAIEPTAMPMGVKPEEHVLSPLVIPEGWPVMGHVYVSAGPMVMLMGLETASPGEATLWAMTRETTTPLDMNSYVTGAKLSYSTDNNATWHEVGSEAVPGSAGLKLEISYANVLITDLQKAGRQITYTLPAFMRNPDPNGVLTSGNDTVGTCVADGKTLTLTFDEVWLSKQTDTVIKGDFTVKAMIDLPNVNQSSNQQLVVGTVKKDVKFEPDVIARYAALKIKKEVVSQGITQEGDDDYLTYRLTLEAGQDAVPEVKVTDAFAEYGSLVQSYVGVNESGIDESVSDRPVETTTHPGAEGSRAGTVKLENGHMIWDVGTMQAGETRTLTYKVKLTKDHFTRYGNSDTIINEATPSSKGYVRTSVTNSFTPKATATITKKSGKFVPNAQGGGTIAYTVWVHADEENNYTLRDVLIKDGMDKSLGGWHGPTDSKYYDYLTFKDFRLYQGGVKDQNGSEGLTEIVDPALNPNDANNPNPVIDAAAGAKSFICSVGPLGPGESKTLTYTVEVAPEAFIAAGNADIPVWNRAYVGRNDSEKFIDYEGCEMTEDVQKKHWARKLVGKKLTDSEEIRMDDGGTSGSSSSFTAPAGSYKYQVVVNEAGDWDLSSATMHDQLSNSNMQFVGYVRVDAYSVLGFDYASKPTDQEAINQLTSKTPAQTVWVNVDGSASFTFKPQDIGLNGANGSNNEYAYLLTYYAQPVNLTSATPVSVKNTFTLTGTIGVGDKTIGLGGVEVETTVVLQGSNRFRVSKKSWYHEPKGKIYPNGAIYWVIEVDSTTIPAGTRLRDQAISDRDGGHQMHEDSLVGVYTGESLILADYADINALKSSRQLQEVSSENYVVSKTDDNTTMTIQFTQKVTPPSGHLLYVIVRTEPTVLPAGATNFKIYQNKIASSGNGTNWVENEQATTYQIEGSDGVHKQLNCLMTFDGTNFVFDRTNHPTVYTQYLNHEIPGTYVVWNVQANYFGKLAGTCRFEETIPNGMELAYICYHSAGNDYPTYDWPDTRDLAGELGAGWTPHENGSGRGYCNYYTNGQTAVWEVEGLAATGNINRASVVFQVACRVTDPNVLLGNQTGFFENQVSLSQDGQNVGTYRDVVEVSTTTLTKEKGIITSTNGGRFPFIIEVNPLGEELVKNANDITLVDKLSAPLKLDETSIEVINTKTKVPIEKGDGVGQWKISSIIDTAADQTFKLTLPNNQPLTITYKAVVNAPPGQPVSIVNSAHWESYTSDSAIKVEDTYQYEAYGTVVTDTNPSLKIFKVGREDALLPGAEFTLQKVEEAADGSFVPVQGAPLWSGTTGADGTLTFVGTDPNQPMEYNVIYCLTETKAPEGYVLDETEYYFAIERAEKDANGNWISHTFPKGVTVYYHSAEIEYHPRNYGGKITVAKAFKTAGGNAGTPIPGTYTFGLYEMNPPTGNPLKTATITYNADGSGDGQTVFEDLDTRNTYYVFELDEKGAPIAHNGMGVTGNGQYVVTYATSGTPHVTTNASSAAEPNAAMPGQTVTVTNQTFTVELPHTGGTGTAAHTLGGLLAMACASGLLLARKKKRR